MNTAYTEYDRARNFSDKAVRSICYAPFTNLYFDQNGNARVCCYNHRFPVGNVNQNTIAEIWNGEPMRRLRASLMDYDLERGCSFCKFQLAGSSQGTLAMGRWDKFPVPSLEQLWPQQMEFSITNTCNLECVMCRGTWSSSIRARREKLPPLKKAYSKRFFTELRPFLPHLRRARFLGGEPFLQKECFRIWDMMIEDGLKTLCHVTTNGTQYNAKVEKALQSLPFEITVSMDGATMETVEGIRKNLKYGAYIENCRRFQAYCREAKRPFAFTYCLMRLNWREFGDLCLMVDDWDVPLWINTVLEPPEFGVYTLPQNELVEIVGHLDKQNQDLLPKLKRNRNVWVGELERLRQACAPQPGEK